MQVRSSHAGWSGRDNTDDAGDGGTGDETGGTTSQASEDAFTIGVLQDITGANGPEFAHMGLTGLLSGFAYKNNQDNPPNWPRRHHTDAYGVVLDMSTGSANSSAILEGVSGIAVRDTPKGPRSTSFRSTTTRLGRR